MHLLLAIEADSPHFPLQPCPQKARPLPPSPQLRKEFQGADPSENEATQIKILKPSSSFSPAPSPSTEPCASSPVLKGFPLPAVLYPTHLAIYW